MARKKTARSRAKETSSRGASKPRAPRAVRRRRHKVLNVAVIGCGKVACDLLPANAKSCRDRWKLGEVPVVTDYRQILAMPEVDGVDICTSSDTHHEIILASLAAGKHLITEKPVGYNLEQCREMRWYARQYAHLKMAVGYSLRYHSIHIEARRLIREGAIGRPTYGHVEHSHGGHGMSGVFDRPAGPRSALSDRSSGSYIAGSELTSTTHPFDLCRYLFGDVKDVFAFKQPYGVFVTMRFESGATVQCTSGSVSRVQPNVLTVQGTDGVLQTRNEYVPPVGTKGKAEEEVDLVLVMKPRGFYINGQGYHEIKVDKLVVGHGDEARCTNFLDAVFHDAELISPLDDAIKTTELLHAIRDSHDHEIRVPIHYQEKTG